MPGDVVGLYDARLAWPRTRSAVSSRTSRSAIMVRPVRLRSCRVQPEAPKSAPSIDPMIPPGRVLAAQSVVQTISFARIVVRSEGNSRSRPAARSVLAILRKANGGKEDRSDD